MSALPRIHEEDLHKALKQWLDLQPVRGMWFHTPNTHSSVQHAVKLKHMGMLAGVFDFIFIDNSGCVAFIEVKRHHSYLNAAQKIVKAWLSDRAIRHAVISTDDPSVLIREAHTMLRIWGFLP